MINAKISAGSSTIVQDIINACQSIHSPIGDWQGFFYKSTTGSKPWCVWAVRMDEAAHELQYVSSSGLAAPPDAYELITVACPTTTGFALSFTQVNAMPSVVQSGKGGGGRGNVSAVPIIRLTCSAAGSTALTDYLNAVASMPTSNLHKFYYISSSGSKPWAVYTFYDAFGFSGVAASILLTIMSGMANPPAESENLAIPAPSTTTLNSNGYTQLSGPLSIGTQ